ncbi:MAG: DUF3276 family protein [Bacteroidota bacterium]|jgi:hypothetical protein
MEEFDNRDAEKKDKNLVFGQQVKAGKRVYFVDVRATNKGDYYLSITESRKKIANDGKMSFEKSKVFLYKEDFEKFLNSLNEAVDFIKKEQPFDPAEYAERRRQYMEERNQNTNNFEGNSGNNYKEVSFDDLG